MPSDRRAFLKQLALLSAALASYRCGSPAAPPPAAAPDAGAAPPEQPSPPLSPAQRAGLAAAVERILPTDHEPGAKEAGVIDFCTEQLRRPELSDIRRRIVAGLLALDRRALRASGKPFAELPAAEQDQLLGETQAGSAQGEQFVRILISITLEGFLSDPKHGGNKDRVGWKMIGTSPCEMMEGTVVRDHGDHAGHAGPAGHGAAGGGHHHE